MQSTSSYREPATLLVSVFIVAACALTYELLISTVSSYFLGSSVLHFSLTIGIFMFFLGMGAFLSKFIQKDELDVFVGVEALLGIIGGCSVLLLQASFSYTQHYYLIAFVLTGMIGTLCGLEIPILTRLLFNYQGLKNTIAHALSFDYVGGLVASILFPLVLLPMFGTLKTAALVGIVNLLVAGAMVFEFKEKLKKPARVGVACFLGALILLFIFLRAERLLSVFEQALYDDDIVFVDQSPYQRIVLTQFHDDLRLYLNGDLQFSARDEYRYHETLVHFPMMLAPQKKQVLILGGGDGLVAREVLKFSEVEHITVVDLDARVTQLARTHALFRTINQDSFKNSKVTILNEDAWNFIRTSTATFDVIIADLPDANDFALGKLYSKEFYTFLSRRLSAEGVFVTQAASPYFTRRAFWCIAHTLQEVFPVVKPLHNFVPSFGYWGYVLATKAGALDVQNLSFSQTDTKYLTKEISPTLFNFDKDMSEIKSGINRLDNQLLVSLYNEDWAKFQQ